MNAAGAEEVAALAEQLAAAATAAAERARAAANHARGLALDAGGGDERAADDDRSSTLAAEGAGRDWYQAVEADARNARQTTSDAAPEQPDGQLQGEFDPRRRDRAAHGRLASEPRTRRACRLSSVGGSSSVKVSSRWTS